MIKERLKGNVSKRLLIFSFIKSGRLSTTVKEKFKSNKPSCKNLRIFPSKQSRKESILGQIYYKTTIKIWREKNFSKTFPMMP